MQEKQQPNLWSLSISSDTSLLFSALGFSQILQGLLVFGIARLLSPVDYGLWSILTLIVSYGALSHLGTINAMHRDVPFYLGRGDTALAAESLNTAFSWTLVCSTFVATAVLVGALLLRGDDVPDNFQLFLLSGLLILQVAYIYLIYSLRARQRFARVARLQVTMGILLLLLVLTLGGQFRLTGVLLGYCLAYGIGIAFLAVTETWDLKFHLNWNKVRDQLYSGIAILLTTMMFLLLTTMDRFFIARNLGLRFLGYFGIGLMVSSFLFNSFDAIAQVLFPRALELYGRTTDQRRVAELYLRNIEGLSYFLAPVLGLAYMLLPVVIPLLLPDYSPGIAAAQWISLGFGAVILAQLTSGFYVVIHKTWRCIWSQLVVLLLKGLALWIVRSLLTIENVSAISSLTNVVYLLVMLLANPAAEFYEPETLMRIALPWLWSFGLLFVVHLGLAAWLHGGLFRGLGAPAIYLIVIVPLLWALYQRVNRRLVVSEVLD